MFKMENKKEDLVGTIIEINDTKYLIDRVFEVEKEFNSERAIEQPRLSITLIEIKSENKAINPEVENSIEEEKVSISLQNIKGFTFRVSKELSHAKLNIVKAFKYVSGLGLKEAKDLVDSMKEIDETGFFMFQYEFPENMLKNLSSLDKIQNLRTNWQDMMRHDLHCNLYDIAISIY